MVAGSVEQPSNDGLVLFRVTDQAHEVPVRYQGILPICSARDRIVAQGELGADGVFTAGEVLAKHDENYMPPEDRRR